MLEDLAGRWDTRAAAMRCNIGGMVDKGAVWGVLMLEDLAGRWGPAARGCRQWRLLKGTIADSPVWTQRGALIP